MFNASSILAGTEYLPEVLEGFYLQVYIYIGKCVPGWVMRWCSV